MVMMLCNFRMLPRYLRTMPRFRRHFLTELKSLPAVKTSSRQNLVIADHCQLILQIRHISFFGRGPPSSTSPVVPEILATPHTPLVSTDSTDFTLIEQLQLGAVKDFHLLDFLGGNSLVKEYDLFSWWSPASWFRLALEYMHFNIDLPWWLTVMCATISLRLLMIFVPIASHRLMGRIQLHKKEIDEFKGKIESAQRNGNFLSTMEAQKEMKDFLKSKDIKLSRQFLLMSLNGAIFMTQFIAVKKLADAAFPGLSTGGLYWFKDLTVPDPYYLLPLISALTVAAVFKMGAETGGTNQGVSPQVQKMLTRIGPVVVFGCSTKVSSAIALYWCTSNIISVIFSGILKIPSVRALLKIPQLPSKQLQSYKKLRCSNYMKCAATKLQENHFDYSVVVLRFVTRFYAAITSAAATTVRSSNFQLQHWVIAIRHASTAKDIFVASQDSLVNIPDIPIITMPPEATSSGFSFYEKWLLKLDMLDIFGLNGSTVDSLGLFSWYSPASWYRIGLEFIHNHFDLPWFASIICTTLCLRLAFLRATLFLQRFAPKKMMHDETLKMFDEKKKEAREIIRSEALYRKISHDENVYIDTYNLRSSNRYYYFLLNSVLFISQYRGIILMAENNFPGWDTGGALWFVDLTATDPNFMVPALSSVLIGCTLFLGYDPTGTASAGKYVKVFKYLLVPAGVFFFSSRVPVAISIYWCASNFFNLLLTTTLRIPKIRYALDIPLKVTKPSSVSFQKAWKRAFGWKKETEKQARSRPVMWEIMQRQDLERFAKAGRSTSTR
uniref:Membrane insertase YidC/Oxa/ALB C-terminal domain-containing protein n=2 Tax=Onchocerca TaxID=6281 RepID=A0A8R1TQF5_ONCVO